jgi:predicted aspartyl protease
MTTFPFSIENDGLIVVQVFINLEHSFFMVLDTGCSHTVLHTKEAEKMGFNLKKARKTTIDTGSQSEVAKEIVVELIEALDYTVSNLTLTVFDVNIDRTKYVGYLGLDFFQDKKLTIDFKNQVLELE